MDYNFYGCKNTKKDVVHNFRSFISPSITLLNPKLGSTALALVHPLHQLLVVAVVVRQTVGQAVETVQQTLLMEQNVQLCQRIALLDEEIHLLNKVNVEHLFYSLCVQVGKLNDLVTFVERRVGRDEQTPLFWTFFGIMKDIGG